MMMLAETAAEGEFELLPCMAMIERDGCIVARNALARRLTGFETAGATPTGEVVLGAYDLEGEQRRLRFDCLVMRRFGAPIAVHAVAQRTTYEGAAARVLLMIERSEGLERESTLLEDVLDAAPEASAITHGTRVLHVNREFTQLFGYAAAECVGQELSELVVPEGRQHESEMLLHTLRQHGRATMETMRRTRSGEEVEVCMLVARVRLGGHAIGMLVTYRDIRRQKQEEARLKHTARHDVLTGLPNRLLFLEKVELTLERLRRRPDRMFAVIFMDLDGFKKVNDTLGHAAGDALLLAVADRLTRCLRPQDTVARFGGDEFALLLDESGSEAEVERVAARIRLEIERGVQVEGAETCVSASVGIAMARPGYGMAEEMLADADAAMYRAKAARGARLAELRADAA